MSIQRKSVFALFGAALLLGAMALPAPVRADNTGIQQFIGAEPTAYSTPEEAAAAFKTALAAGDMAGLAKLLGLDEAKLKGFEGITEKVAELQAASAKLFAVEADGDRRIVNLGTDVWPFPFPIVKDKDGKWFFDTYAGLEEIVNRRVGDNELQAIATAEAYVDAQRDYAAEDRDGDGVLEYAQKLISSEGLTDGLYWPIEQGDGESPVGPFISQGTLDKVAAGEGYFGYNFRILQSQGENIAGGAYDYVINGNMIAGFALVAWPTKYAATGVNTIVVNHAGIVYQRDLGEDTAKLVEDIKTFNPDAEWTVVED
jgi:hypothetical protein